MAGRERTDPNCICVGKKRPSLRSFSCRFFQLVFCASSGILIFGNTNFKRCVFAGAMCFASGSIFGNKFLTPAGMKTLFPIFENTLCGKVLAVKTRTPIFEENQDV